jgi:hypothetical protein
VHLDCGKVLSETPVSQKFCAVVYRQVNENDGFVVTAYFTSRPASWRRMIWKR